MVQRTGSTPFFWAAWVVVCVGGCQDCGGSAQTDGAVVVDGADVVDGAVADGAVFDRVPPSDVHAGDAHRGDSYLGDSYLGDSHRRDSYLGDSYLGDSYLGDSYLGDVRYPDARTAISDAWVADTPTSDSAPVDAGPLDVSGFDAFGPDSYQPPRDLGEPCVQPDHCQSMACYDLGGSAGLVCSECQNTGQCGPQQDCLYDVAVGYARCRGIGELGQGCSLGSACLSGYCHSEICSLCETSADCQLDLDCQWKLPEGYAICLDPSEERVNADFSSDGVFERIGCNSNCNGCTCDLDADGHADGICVGEDCVADEQVAIVLDCDIDSCSSDDLARPAYVGCSGHAGLACTQASQVQDNDAYFVQTGLCLCFTPEFCMCQSGSSGDYLCYDAPTYLHQTDCVEGLPCDDSFVGNFDPNYGVANGISGLCDPAICNQERVDIDLDGSFSQCGCAYNSQGFLCHLNGDTSAKGLCAGEDCVTTPPVSRGCFRERCDQQVEVGCANAGHACDSAFLQPQQQQFEHRGYCADVAGELACVIQGHICRNGGAYLDSCARCDDGDPCDQTLTDGAFDPSYGQCSAGSCLVNQIPEQFDWRDVDGGNWTTPAANQGRIGACTVFGALSAIESRWNIQSGDPDLDINLSEQTAVSCGGWSVLGAHITLDYVRDQGIPDEACFVWQNNAEALCELICADHEDRRWSITDYQRVDDYRNMPRLTLLEQGPLVAIMKAGGMTRDASGIYYCPSHSGGHAVAVVGWNDTDGYWIVKNSWGPSWNAAEQGFFRLYYGECGLDLAYSIDDVIAP